MTTGRINQVAIAGPGPPGGRPPTSPVSRPPKRTGGTATFLFVRRRPRGGRAGARTTPGARTDRGNALVPDLIRRMEVPSFQNLVRCRPAPKRGKVSPAVQSKTSTKPALAQCAVGHLLARADFPGPSSYVTTLDVADRVPRDQHTRRDSFAGRHQKQRLSRAVAELPLDCRMGHSSRTLRTPGEGQSSDIDVDVDSGVGRVGRVGR